MTVSGSSQSGSTLGGKDGGGGSGGSILVEADKITNLYSASAPGGNGGSNGGAGSLGRIAVYYLTEFFGNFTPGYLEKAGTEDTIFHDGFEENGLNTWSSNVNDSNDLTASDSADYWFDYGMSAVIDDNTAIYVQDDSPVNETEYRARFYVNPNNLTMANGDALDLFTGESNSVDVFHIQMQKVDSIYKDDRDTALQYSGTWTQASYASAYAGTYSASSVINNSVTYTFSSDQVKLLYTKSNVGGMLDVYLDNVKVDTINQYSATTTWQNVWSSSSLTNGVHVLKLVHASGTTVYVDALQTINNYQIRAGLLSDGGTWTESSWYDISTSWNAVEIDYQAFINSGSLTLWLNDVQKQSILYIDNDTRPVTEVRLGAQGIETGTRGTVYFDDFDSRRFSYIGTLPDPGVYDPQATNPAGWQVRTFSYSEPGQTGQPHAVKKVSPETGDPDTYVYDQNGNMTCRTENGITYKQNYNSENRISSIHKMSGGCAGTATDSWTYTYDGDGVRVSTAYFTAGTPNPQAFTAYYMGGSFEVNGSMNGSTFTETGTKSYYAIAGMTVAMEDSTGVQYLLTDHLGSVVATTNASGTLTSQQRYLPFGEARTDVTGPSASPTDFTYTGQRDLPGTGLMDYKARMFSPYLNLDGL